MRRKLIKQEAFEKLASNSAVEREQELLGAERVLSKAVGQHLQLHSFNESTVLFETDDDSFVHAGYKIQDGKISFSNLEELVIDEDSKTAKRRETLSNMLESLLRDKEDVAKSLFVDYMKLTSFDESKKFVIKSKEDEEGNTEFSTSEKDDKKESPSKLPKKKSPFDKIKEKRERDEDKKEKSSSKGIADSKKKDAFIKKVKSAGKKIEEVYRTAENVLNYVEFHKLGPVLNESTTQKDSQGNVVAIEMPSEKVRNEGKLLNFDWKVLNHKCKVLRSGAKELCEDSDFVKSVADLKVQNNVSNSEGLEECLDQIAVKWPNVIYLTQDELAAIVSEALEIAGERNFDDHTCQFMAEGILRRVYDSYADRVNQIMSLANASKNESEQDGYEHFATVVNEFFPYVDYKTGVEMRVFEDLYESLSEIYNVANRRGNNDLKSQTAGMLNDLTDILNNDARPDIEFAEEVAQWLTRFVEANVQGASDTWNVSNMPHHTINGDHPQMSRNSKVPAIAGSYEGDWDDPAPMISQDKSGYKGNSETARSNSWGNIGGKETFPTLNNPYIPQPFGDYTMSGEKGVDKDTFGQHHGSWQSKDTWPNLDNPYIPREAGSTGGQGYKMKNGSETDLIVDKGVNTSK